MQLIVSISMGPIVAVMFFSLQINQVMVQGFPTHKSGGVYTTLFSAQKRIFGHHFCLPFTRKR